MFGHVTSAVNSNSRVKFMMLSTKTNHLVGKKRKVTKKLLHLNHGVILKDANVHLNKAKLLCVFRSVFNCSQ